MRSQYTEEEQVYLKELLRLLSGEVARAGKIISTCVNHLIVCETPEHRATVAHQAKEALANMISSLRYCSWIEAEFAGVRVFDNPGDILHEIVKSMDNTIASFKPVSPMIPESEQIKLLPLLPPAEEMDKLASAPFPSTKQ